ncbi:MAG: succinate dehydrogenase cytochrome b subunit [Flavobacteriales bacterium]|nr:succinate dehydrogenase cytochrome b subunit [Flavobacteriales bacterium]
MSVSIVRKVAMALSGFFLLSFLLLHVSINLLSVCCPAAFDSASHFMGTFWLIQFVMQPVLAFGVVFHLVLGFILELKNRSSRPVKYAFSNAAASSTWMSRNMIITGVMVLLFLGLHFYDFWFPELNVKYMQGDMSGLVEGTDRFRYWEELHHKFQDPIRVGLYVLAFVFLGLHLMHGFQSAFQSVGFNHRRYTPIIKKLSNIYAIVVPLGFVIVAVYHFLAQ